jgi:signal transduction histidine kinase
MVSKAQKFVTPEGSVWLSEDVLAHARLGLAVVCAIVVYLGPAYVGRRGSLGGISILAYLTFSVISITVERLHRPTGSAWLACTQAIEVIVVSAIVMSTGGIHSRFLELYLFLFFVAACRWSFNGTLFTSGGCVLMLILDFDVSSAWPAYASLLMHRPDSIGTLMALSTSLVALACLLSVLVERVERPIGDTVVIAQILRSTIPDMPLKTAIGNVLSAVRQHFDADRVRLAVQEARGGRAVAWEATRLAGNQPDRIRVWNLTESTREACFAMPPEGIRRALQYHSLDEGERHQPRASQNGQCAGSGGEYIGPLQIINERHSPAFSSWWLLATSFAIDGKWLGRLTVYNPCNKRREANTDSEFLGTLVRQIGPAIYAKYLMGRLRSRAQAQERTRLAQDLHDGVIQSLIGLEMQMDLLRRTHTDDPVKLLGEIDSFQKLLHEEILHLREEMQRVSPLEVEPGRLLDRMAGTVDRFRQEDRISARFVSEVEQIALPPRVCTELVRILQEALVNVRKHSGAHNVVVRFGRANGHYKLCVEDDGRGFSFSGRLSGQELERSADCPVAIHGRLGAIGGELMVESVPGSGARLEILVPLSANG